MTREEAKSRLEWICKNHKCLSLESKHCYEALNKAIEALENQKTGNWIEYKTDKLNFLCSKCHFFSNKNYKYCPNCGAKMKGE